MIASADGCKGGWLALVADEWPCRQTVHAYVCHDFKALLALTRSCDAVVVDIPIGLPEPGQVRLCDTLARDRLGREGRSRVFLAPPRETLDAGTPVEFQTRYRGSFGKGAGLPVWGIVPKLREADAGMTPALQSRVREFHPELAWARLAGRVLSSKHTKKGLAEREDLLRSNVAEIDALKSWVGRLGRAAATDDLLDALVGLAVAEGLRGGNLVSERLPTAQPAEDARGLCMEIWF